MSNRYGNLYTIGRLSRGRAFVMIYKGYEIQAEVVTDTAIYSLDENGQIDQYEQNMSCEPYISYYGIVENTEDGDIIEWFETLEEAKKAIDNLNK